MDKVFLWVLLVFCVYRLADLVAVDTISQQVREWFGQRVGEKYSPSWYFTEWLNCPYCLGVWFAAVAALVLQPSDFLWFLIYWLSIAGAQARLVNRV